MCLLPQQPRSGSFCIVPTTKTVKRLTRCAMKDYTENGIVKIMCNDCIGEGGGGRILRRLLPKTCWMVLARASLIMRKSSSAESRPGAMGCVISGWIPIASTSQTTTSLLKPLTPCSAGIRIRLGATYICRTFGYLARMPATRSASEIGNLIFGKADGSPGVTRFKSCWL